MRYNIGIDVGGTFTDFLVADTQEEARAYKTPTTPKQPEVGVFRGLEKIAASQNLSLREFLTQVATIVHGTTITTNAVLTSTGAKTAFLTTKGFRDLLNMRRGLKNRPYDSKYAPPSPLVPRHRIYPIEERVNVEGNVVVPLNEQDVHHAIAALCAEGVEAVAISYLWSFLAPDHERRTAALIRDALPDLNLSLSSEILPQIRAYERHSTTVLNAYVSPPLNRYLTNLEKRLAEEGFPGVLLIMQSNGGVMSPSLTRRFAANTLLSGPAGGPMAGIFYGDTQHLTDVITVDMGGTSFDACLIRQRRPAMTTEGEVGGHRLALPMLDIHTVGAGGGSIAWIDAGGLLQVGPKSADAEPGPVCYGLGGTEPTVTDADLLLGYLDPEFFLGGEIRLDRERAALAMQERIAKPLGLSETEAAEGIYRIINDNMAAALRVVSVERGYDPREFALVVAGGAGPLHAGMIARELGIPLVLIPRESSVFCAAGMLISDLQHDYVRTLTREWQHLSLTEVNQIFTELEDDGRTNLAQEGIAADQVRIEASLDMRYVGQFHEVEVATPHRLTQDDLQAVERRFHHTHDTLYGYALPGAPLEVINLRLRAMGVTEKPHFEAVPYVGTDPHSALKGSRSAFFAGEWHEVPVYDGLKCEHGFIIAGPALVEQPNTTILVPPTYTLVCDAYRNYVMHTAERRLDDLLKDLRAEGRKGGNE